MTAQHSPFLRHGWTPQITLATVAVFVNLDHAERAKVEHVSTVLEPRDGAEVFSQGDIADAVYAIVSGDGHVRIRAADKHSKSLMVEVFHIGEIFGEIGVIDGGPRSAAAIVEGRMKLVRIPGAVFLSALSRDRALGEALSRLFACRLRRTFGLFQDASFETLEVRLARQLLYLADREGRDTVQGIRLARHLRQNDLADLLGATTRSIITILNTWRAAGVVLYDTERAYLTLRDPGALRAIARQAADSQDGRPVPLRTAHHYGNVRTLDDASCHVVDPRERNA
jgi:CRP/FNR family transcriptional regulator, cyclic AMP receptor protein